MTDDALPPAASGILLCSWLDAEPPLQSAPQVDAAEVWLTVDFEAEDSWTGQGEPALSTVGPIPDLDTMETEDEAVTNTE